MSSPGRAVTFPNAPSLIQGEAGGCADGSQNTVMIKGPRAVLGILGHELMEKRLCPPSLPEGKWEMCESMGREVLCDHVERLLWRCK